ncbi:Ca(2+)-dependent cysteine protease [Steccherinum ochraceum]|uniref:Ca(2+)-dependent cysteine protease n=1 Tax=Steccherinum ochraceum TaxID=92696 RepID=A0A4R0RYU6_9APHY|nr:Ca(2+)-dependent cysteine protease [Steccherinum ochraceum]
MAPIPVCIPQHDEPSQAYTFATNHIGDLWQNTPRPRRIALPLDIPLCEEPGQMFEPPIVESRRTPWQKALLIGINYTRSLEIEGFEKLYTPQNDVQTFKQLLLDVYGFKPEDIVVMTDRAGTNIALVPTRANILREMESFVRGAQPGDSFVFMYAGHSDQVKNRTGTEDDAMDEVILPVDHQGIEKEHRLIKDNDLKKLLVNPLPIGARLTALFDSCHSGTLLDLPHYKCNTFGTNLSRISRQGGRSNSGGTARSLSGSGSPGGSSSVRVYQRKGSDKVLRKNSIELSPLSPTPVTPSNTLMHRVLVNNAVKSNRSPPGSQHSADGVVLPRTRTRSRSQSIPSSSLSMLSVAEAVMEKENEALRTQPPRLDTSVFSAAQALDLAIPQCTSPAPMELFGHSSYCNGDCLASPTIKPMVLSISACKDEELTYEDVAGEAPSLIQAMVEVLKQDPRPSLEVLMERLGEAMKEAAYKRVEWYREFRAMESKNGAEIPDVKRALQDERSMRTQSPQFGSHKPLNRSDFFTFLADPSPLHV